MINAVTVSKTSSISSATKTDQRKSKANHDFDVYEDRWQITADDSINLVALEKFNLDEKFEENFKLVLADYASEFSTGYLVNIYQNIRHLFATGVTNKINEEHILNYKATLNSETEYKLGSLRAFILDWDDKGYKGIDKKALKLLSKLRLKGTPKGKAVATGCPYSGAYTYDEQAAFIAWYVDAYTNDDISLTEYSFTMALQQTGARTTQLCMLYNQDLVKVNKNGIELFNLKLPNAKKRKEGFRDSYRVKEAINEDLALVLNAQANHSIKYIENHFNILLSETQKKTIPIFLNEKYISKKVNSFSEFESTQTQTPDSLWIRRSRAASLVANVAKLCPLKTERIFDGDLHINPRRFRYTHATNLAMIGASVHVIAYELGHSDTQSATVYTEFTEEVAEYIDDALEPSLVPLAQAFQGVLIDSEKDAIRANDPRSRINTDHGNPIGNCGQHGFCASGTIHCYTCNKFQPWLSAPHDKLLEQVLSERDRKKNMGATAFTLQGHNRSIDAIKIVIQKCQQRKDELEKEGAINV
jgi:hypothetical protein